ncbi:M15 family metallopeptidase [Lysinibacillus sp. NPDC086135]|uniref:M15 family metallopeptidase n=1 Tax=Lysinibacillus sp. NPDC086135 TaxID=3364130 RepID=UPI00382E0454
MSPKSLYNVTTLNKVGAITKRLGVTWGGTWTKAVDRPHLKLNRIGHFQKVIKLKVK